MNPKQHAAQFAAQSVRDGMIIGLGTGSTADCFIQTLAELQKKGMQFSCVASSIVSFRKAKALGLTLQTIEQIDYLDLYVDGADEVDPQLTLLKGQGSDLVKEKLLATACDRFLVLVDGSKRVERIGQNFPVPIEVMPMAWALVKKQLQAMGGEGDLRCIPGKENLMLSSHGSLILDMVFPVNLSATELNTALDAMPGVVEHGIFHELTSALIVGTEKGVEEQLAI
jgi:ribose 5-phosphate isomerase A